MAKLENIVSKLENYKAEHEAKRDAWQGVTLEKKKNGGEFEQIGRGLTGGASLFFDSYESDKLHPKIRLFANSNGRYIESYIYCYGFLDEHPEKEKDHEIRRNGYSRATFIFTPDEIREAIKHQAEAEADFVKSYEAQIKAAKKAFTAYEKAITEAEKTLKINSGCAGEMFPNTLYFEIKENVK